MMENESLRGSRNTAVIFLTLVLVVVLVWAIAATVVAAKRGKQYEAVVQEKEDIQRTAEQKMLEADRRVAEAERLRRTALEWTRQAQAVLQQEAARKRAEEEKAKAAAKPADKPAAKPAAKPATTTRKPAARPMR